MKSKFSKLIRVRCCWLIVVFSFSLLLPQCSQAQLYRDSTATIDQRIADLLARMTPEEKFWQLFMLAGEIDKDPARFRNGVFGLQINPDLDIKTSTTHLNQIQHHFVEKTRLGIPALFFAEALHGLVQKDAPIFPQAIALAATFDTSLVHRISANIAQSCRDQGIRQVLSPVINIATDVRWGRTEETYGEDPYLSSAMGVAFVSEFERLGVVTTPKHFIANVGDGGRDSYPIQISERNLRELHLPPFEATIKQGGSRSVMTSYNSYDGQPSSANKWLITDLLKQEIGFQGFVISDAGAVGGANVLHFTASDYHDASAKAIDAGLDVIFQTSIDHDQLFNPPFLNGRLPSSVIDSAVARVLRVKFELGLFEHPYVTPIDFTSTNHHIGHDLALSAALESIVLLKNENQVLPILPRIRSIAVIGPDADTLRFGGYSAPTPNQLLTILDGIKAQSDSAVSISYAQGCGRTSTEFVTVPESQLSHTIDGISLPGIQAEYFANISLSGTPTYTKIDPKIHFDWTLFSPDPSKLAADNYSVRWSGSIQSPITGKFKLGLEGNDGYRLYLNNSLVIDHWRKISTHSDVVEVNFIAGQPQPITVEFSEPVGNAHIRLIWNGAVTPDEDTKLEQAAALAARSDVAIVVVGIEEGEFRDRSNLSLPGKQEALIQRVAATGKPTVVVLVGGSAITMSKWIDQVAAVVAVWYPGEQGGRAVGEVLFGRYNPSGRLPITFPLSEGQLPLVYNHKPTGRGDDYLDQSGLPLFPFGFGLSYSSFEYSNLRILPETMTSQDTAIVSFTLKNTSSVAGDEVVQLYIRDELASVARPVMELKGFQRVMLKPAQSTELKFTITPETLAMFDKDLHKVVEPGSFRIMIGASSRDLRLKGILIIK